MSTVAAVAVDCCSRATRVTGATASAIGPLLPAVVMRTLAEALSGMVEDGPLAAIWVSVNALAPSLTPSGAAKKRLEPTA